MNDKLIISNAQKVAARVRKRKKEFSQNDFLSCRISTVALWKRLLVILLAITFCILSAYLFIKADNPVWGSLIAVLGITILLVGILGCRQKVDAVLSGLDSAVSNSIIDALF